LPRARVDIIRAICVTSCGFTSLNVPLAEWSVNPQETIRRSRAVGKQLFTFGMSVLEAISMAAASIADYHVPLCIDTPATTECVLMAILRMRAFERKG